MMKAAQIWTPLLLLLGVLAGCAAPPPYKSYTLARTALQAARDVESPRYASGFWHKAEEHYRVGEKAFKEYDYTKATKSFERARVFAEKAENATRLKKFQSGEGFP